MRVPGPPIEVTRGYTSTGVNGRKILVINCELPIFADHIVEEDSAKNKPRKQKTTKKRLTLTSKIQRLGGVFFFLHTADYSATLVLCPGTDPEQVESAVRRVITRHHQWQISRPNPNSGEEFWSPAH